MGDSKNRVQMIVGWTHEEDARLRELAARRGYSTPQAMIKQLVRRQLLKTKPEVKA